MFRSVILVFILLSLIYLTVSLDICLPDGIFCYTVNLHKNFPKCCGVCLRDIQRLNFNGICRPDNKR